MKKKIFLVILTILVLSVGGCGGDGHHHTPATSTMTGNAAKGPIEGATVQVFYFNTDGNQVEIVAHNAPVTTDAAGAYEFEFNISDLEGVTSPLIVRTVGGTMGGQPAPQLKAVVADPSALVTAGNTLTTYLSTASSVVAALLSKQAQATGAVPNTTDANNLATRVETQLGVDLTADPATSGTGVAQLNENVDINLDLINTPFNNNAVDDLVEYLVANLSSTSNVLDENMDDPNNPGSDVAADFAPFGGGDLAALLPGGPSDFLTLSFSTDKTSILRNGTDAATLTATLLDATNSPVPDGTQISVKVISGTGELSNSSPDTINGEAETALTSTVLGPVTVEASYQLPNGNTLSEIVTITAISNPCDPRAPTVTASPTVIEPEGTSNITATVSAADSSNCPDGVADGTRVEFSVTAGDGTVSPTSDTTTNGVAETTLTAGSEVGTVTVTATVTDQGVAYTGTADVTVISDPCDPRAPTVTANPTSIGPGESSSITATVPAVDPSNCPDGVADGTRVEFSVTAGDGTVSPTSDTTTNGVAETTLTAGSEGTVTIAASVTDSQGVAHSNTVDVSVGQACTTTTVTASLTGIASGTELGGLDLTIDYPEGKVTFSGVAAGTLTQGATVIPTDDGDKVRSGLLLATGFDGGGSGSVMVFTFNANICPVPGDFIVNTFLATDLMGVDAGLDATNVSLDVVNQ